MAAANEATMQASLDIGYNTPVPPTSVLPFITEGLVSGAVYAADPANVGSKTSGKPLYQGSKPNGPINLLLTPEEFGLIMGWCMGTELAVADVVGSVGGKKHTFIPGLFGAGTRPPSISVIKSMAGQGYQRFIGLQVVSWTLTLNPNDNVTLDVTTRGVFESDEADAGTLYPTFVFNIALIPTALEPYKMCGATLKIDGLTFQNIDTLTINYDNSLTDYGNGPDGTCNVRDNQYGERIPTANFTAQLDTASYALRRDKFQKQAQVSVELILDSGQEYETDYNYIANFLMPGARFTVCDTIVPDTGQITMTATLQAWALAGQEALTVTHDDLQATKYIP